MEDSQRVLFAGSLMRERADVWIRRLKDLLGVASLVLGLSAYICDLSVMTGFKDEEVCLYRHEAQELRLNCGVLQIKRFATLLNQHGAIPEDMFCTSCRYGCVNNCQSNFCSRERFVDFQEVGSHSTLAMLTTVYLTCLPGISFSVSDLQVSPHVTPSYEPCNDFPEYCQLPIDWSIWLGAIGSGSSHIDQVLTLDNGSWAQSTDIDSFDYLRTQQRKVTSMLDDGIRLLRLDLCARYAQVQTDHLNDSVNLYGFLSRSDEQPYICRSEENATAYITPFKNYLEESFQFMIDHPKQAIILHLEDNPMDTVDIQQIEKVIDEVCVELANRTLGVKHFHSGECPWIYTIDAAEPLPTVGEVIGYDPDMAQWEGDGEDVGVQSKMIITHSQDFIKPYGYKATYMSQPFWTSTYEPIQDFSQLKSRLRKLCKKPIAIEVVASLSIPPSQCSGDEECVKTKGIFGESSVFSPAGPGSAILSDKGLLLDALYSKQACNMGSIAQLTRLVAVSVNFYEENWTFLKNQQRKWLQENSQKLEKVKSEQESKRYDSRERASSKKAPAQTSSLHDEL
ncbi:hypothetical protein NQZ79_g1697 [Umbelopsis isabellina]|nr:hypothetical protein NQZ79_g1697 [Umbelopsis isabellina]